MAFYTAEWTRKLAKEDAKFISDYVKKSSNDFRDYIDANTPFVLWLDIGLIRERILNKQETKDWILDLAQAVVEDSDPDPKLPSKIYDILDTAYQNTIDAYANNPKYEKINAAELEEILSSLSTAEVGQVKSTITKVILPKFTTLEFGKVYKKELEILVNKAKWLKGNSAVKPVAASPFSMFPTSNISNSLSEKGRFLLFVNENFATLQNIGHVEVDVISEKEKIVKRGQNSPRLLQALMTLPKDVKAYQRLQLKFSKETGQATTRVKIRKQFTGRKLVFEMLIEHGLAVGIPETQASNLLKAQLERAFDIGKGLTAQIRKDPTFLAQLQTSKSLLQYAEQNLLSVLKTGKNLPKYTSNTTITETSRVIKQKVKVSTNNPTTNKGKSKVSNLKATKSLGLDLLGLQTVINSMLAETIAKNMGNGTRRDILNLRSGRFANSVSVERMSQSREGMVTAFYTYMKYPYQTFEPGYRQGKPESRNPKLLISRSIREIAAEKVANKLRAVSI
jgi:hypothetical protein